MNLDKRGNEINCVNCLAPQVSICIPTYNREQYLRKSIESIISQKEFVDGQVEIVISDNASDDKTEELCREYKKKYRNFIYHRNEENTGLQGIYNQRDVTKYSSGNLIKLSNDDFIFEDGSLKLFCEYEETYNKEKPQLLFTNGNLNSNKKRKLSHYPVDFEGYIYSIGYYITWMGNFSIWKSDLEKYIDDEAGIKYMFWHLVETLDVLSEKNKGIIEDARFGHRQNIIGKNVNYNLFECFYVHYDAVFKPFYINGNISEKCYKWALEDMLMNFLIPNSVRQELKIGDWEYSKDLWKESVINQCKANGYYKKAIRRYYYWTYRLKCTQFIRRVINKKQ